MQNELNKDEQGKPVICYRNPLGKACRSAKKTPNTICRQCDAAKKGGGREQIKKTKNVEPAKARRLLSA